MITGELALMFQSPHTISMEDFCTALESCPGMGSDRQTEVAQWFIKNAVSFSDFWESCTSVEYWVLEDEGKQLKAEPLKPEKPASHFGSNVGQPNHNLTTPDLDLTAIILRSQNAVARARSLQSAWRQSMEEAKRRASEDPSPSV